MQKCFKGRVLVTVSKGNVEAFTRFFEKLEVDYLFLGNVKGSNAVVDGGKYFGIEEMKGEYEGVIEGMLG